MEPSFSAPIWYTAFLATLVLSISRLLAHRRLPLAPGPRGWPIIGNILQLIGVGRLELLLQRWAGNFGDIIYIRVLNQQMVVLNNLDVIRDLLEKRSSIYSDRPAFTMLTMMGWQDVTPLVRYGPRFRKHRRFIHQTFNENASKAFHPLQEREISVLLENLIISPRQFTKHFRQFTAATIFPITYGHPVTSMDDGFLKLAEKALALTLATGSMSATLVDFFPVLRHIPLWAPCSGFKHKALEARKSVDEMMSIPLEMVKKAMSAGGAQACFTSTLMEQYCDPEKSTYDSENETIIKGTAGILFAAAEDTTDAVMETFVLAMVRYPEVLQKAQAEIDKIVGRERLPNLADRPSLPYIECILKEVLRWNPPVPLGVPHRAIENNMYHGYLIPEGATVLPNIFAILHDCDKPDEFIPERYTKSTNLPDPKDVVFGFGRRICPGRYFAVTSIWCMMTNVIAAFNIERSPEDKTNDVFPELDVISSFVCHPKPFSCAISPRSEKVMALVRETNTFTKF